MPAWPTTCRARVSPPRTGPLPCRGRRGVHDPGRGNRVERGRRRRRRGDRQPHDGDEGNEHGSGEGVARPERTSPTRHRILQSPPDGRRVVVRPGPVGKALPTARVGISPLPCASYDGPGDGRRARHDLLRALQRDRGQHRDRHPGQARGRRAGARLPPRRGPPAHRGRARRRQDEPGQGAGRLDRLARGSGCSSRPTCCRPTSSASRVWNRGRDIFEFRPGPVFANIVLGDEINRASPKTQSALLEAMEERQVTVDGTTYPLASPFMVIATQNPIEHEGTYPLPESQLDRFLMRLSVGLPEPPVRAGDPRHPRRRRHAVGGPSGRHRRADPVAGRLGEGRPRGARAEALPGRPGRRHPPPPERRPRHVAPRHAVAPAGGPGPGRRRRAHLRHPGRHQGARRPRARPTASCCPPTPSCRASAPARSSADVLGAVPVPDGEVARAHPAGVGAPRRRRRRPRSRPAPSASSSCTSSAPSLAILAGRPACSTCGRHGCGCGSSRTLSPARVHAGDATRVELGATQPRHRRTPVLRLRDPVGGTRGALLHLAPAASRASRPAPPTGSPPTQAGHRRRRPARARGRRPVRPRRPGRRRPRPSSS